MALLTRVRSLEQDSIFAITNSLTSEGIITDISVPHESKTELVNQQKKVKFITEPIIVENQKLQDKKKKKTANPQMEAYDNSLFQHDEDHSILKNATYISRFGKKGRGIGYLGDASDIKYVGNNVVLVTDMSNNRLQTFDVAGKVLNVCEMEKDSCPTCAIMTLNNQVAVTSRLQKCVLVLSKQGDVVKTVGQGNYQWPFGIAQDSQSCRIAVTDQLNHSVNLLDENFNLILQIKNKENMSQILSKPRHVTFSDKGHIIVSDSGNHSVKVFDQNGSMVTSFGTFGRGVSELRAPYGVCVDQFGDILVADHYNDRVSCFDIRGHWQHDLICFYHGLRRPQGITLTSKNKLCVTHGGLKATEIAIYDLLSLQMENQDMSL